MIPFVVALAATLACLGGAIWAGLTRRRSAHYALVAAMFATLLVTIWEARVWGSGLIFDGASGQVQVVHRAAVVLTFALVPVLAWTGVRLARGPGETAGARARHRRAAVWFVIALVLAAAFGTVMTVLARRS